MCTWTTQQWIAGQPDEVAELLADPLAIARWSPVAFEVLDLAGDRLDAGAHAQVAGTLAGRRLSFDIDIHEASSDRLSLTANGPVSINADYEITSERGGTNVKATVSVDGRGLLGRLLARAVHGLLAAGALDVSLLNLNRQLETAPAL